MLYTSTFSRRSPRHTRSRRRRFAATFLATLAPALFTLLLSPASASTTASLSTTSLAKLPNIAQSGPSDVPTTETETETVGQRQSSRTPSGILDPLNRRKHVTFQDVDQQHAPPASDRSPSEAIDGSVLPIALQFEDIPTAELHPSVDAEYGIPHLPHSGSRPPQLSDVRRYESQRPDSRPNGYNQDLIGKQTGGGYVFVHNTDPMSISAAGAALATLFSRRDSPLSRPPLVPNSNSRLLIGLVIVCILAVGVLTLATQEMYRRMQSLSQPRSPLRRRSGEARFSRPMYRSDSSYASVTSNGLAAPSLEEEEERIKTPPTLSRRSSAAASSIVPGSDSEDEDNERKTPSDLHYLSLPFGIGIGYSYAHIADGGEARTRINRLARESRRRSGSTLALSSGALPIPGLSAGNGTGGLRSRSRSFKELCRDAFGTTTSDDFNTISEEEGDSDMTTVLTPRWGSSLVSLDFSGSERGSGNVTPTGPSASGAVSASTSSIALEDFASQGSSLQSAKGRFFGMENATSAHTLIDLSVGTPELAVSDPDGITRPASTPGVMPSQVVRHPQVEQLRREGRSETGKRVGKGTPTNPKLH